jgi:biopolymer transport protein ExbD
VLLVFFITITSASSLRSDRDVNLPVGTNASKKQTARSEAVLNVKWVAGKKSGVVAVESQVIGELADLTKLLAERYKADNNYRVVIRADRVTPADFVEKVMGACGEAGISDISFAVLNHD